MSAAEVIRRDDDRPAAVLTDSDIELHRRRDEQQLPRFDEAALTVERRISVSAARPTGNRSIGSSLTWRAASRALIAKDGSV
ncbi:MAG: hypothetical protein EXS13_13940 [Planctomycetes bacterium]|nr:hypothetical protein [Planctomycetota bacterium]